MAAQGRIMARPWRFPIGPAPGMANTAAQAARDRPWVETEPAVRLPGVAGSRPRGIRGAAPSVRSGRHYLRPDRFEPVGFRLNDQSDRRAGAQGNSGHRALDDAAGHICDHGIQPAGASPHTTRMRRRSSTFSSIAVSPP